MKRNDVLNTSGLIMIILGIIMIVLGVSAGPKVLIPPIVTGIGFMVVAWVFMMLKER